MSQIVGSVMGVRAGAVASTAGSSTTRARSAVVMRAQPRSTGVATIPGGGLRGSFRGAAVQQQLPRRQRQEQQQGSAAPGRRSVQVQASFLGVGAPEAVMVGVVALVVFGPKGLASAAKSLGAAAKSLQPSIRELAEVSNDLKTTLEEEIGLNEIKKDFQGISSSLDDTLNPMPRKTPLPDDTGLAEMKERAAKNVMLDMDAAKTIDPDIEEKRRAAAAAAWGTPPPAAAEAAPVATAAKDLDSMSVDELREEIARRKAAAAAEKPSES